MDAFAISMGLLPVPIENTSTPCFSPLTLSCSTAAGLYISQAVRSGFLPFDLNLPANFAAVVVLPAPCKPTIIMTVISFPDFSGISVVVEPIRETISSLTIFITI